MALANFNDETEPLTKAKVEAEKLKEIQETLIRIKQQLDSFSN